jgi:tetratricopeptide (TPR) repeat protein
MSTVKAFFRFEIMTLCGVPRVTLEGTPSDWAVLADKVAALKRFAGLEFWLPALENIAKQLSAASNGNIDRDFWRDICKVNDMSGGPYINGWMTHLIPYTECGGTLTINPCLKGGEISVPSLPAAISSAPIQWEYLGEKLDYEFLSGFMGIEQDRKTLALRPKIGWAVRASAQAANSFSQRRRAAMLENRSKRMAPPTPPPGELPLPMLAEQLLRQGRFDEAISAFTKLIEQEPKHYLYRLKRGRAYSGAKAFERAIADFNSVIEINPELAVTYAERGKLYFAMGRFAESKQDTEKANLMGYRDNGNI